jgi:hypothetical protein
MVADTERRHPHLLRLIVGTSSFSAAASEHFHVISAKNTLHTWK